MIISTICVKFFTLDFNITNVPIRQSITGEMFNLFIFYFFGLVLSTVKAIDIIKDVRTNRVVGYPNIGPDYYLSQSSKCSLFHSGHALIRPHILFSIAFPSGVHRLFAQLIRFGFFWGLFKPICSREENASFWAFGSSPVFFSNHLLWKSQFFLVML